MESYLNDISKVKLKQFAEEVKSLDAGNLRDIAENKRYTLIFTLYIKKLKTPSLLCPVKLWPLFINNLIENWIP